MDIFRLATRTLVGLSLSSIQVTLVGLSLCSIQQVTIMGFLYPLSRLLWTLVGLSLSSIQQVSSYNGLSLSSIQVTMDFRFYIYPHRRTENTDYVCKLEEGLIGMAIGRKILGVAKCDANNKAISSTLYTMVCKCQSHFTITFATTSNVWSCIYIYLATCDNLIIFILYFSSRLLICLPCWSNYLSCSANRLSCFDNSFPSPSFPPFFLWGL